MLQPLWKILLELLGKPRLPLTDRSVIEVTTGPSDVDDADSSMGWFDLASSEKLFATWGPVPGGPWEAYHCAPLFAALDRIPKPRRGPTNPESAKTIEEPLDAIQQWLVANRGEVAPGTWLIVDLPGEQSVPVAATLIGCGAQPICTFDHWPHAAGLLRPERILGQLLRHATRADRLRRHLTKDSPPAWICDRSRLGGPPGQPQQFDNRYFLDDSILPGPAILRAHRISRVLYISEDPGQAAPEDLAAYFDLIRKELAISVLGIPIRDTRSGFYNLPPAPIISRFSKDTYVRAAAGGFGTLIPSESSSSG